MDINVSSVPASFSPIPGFGSLFNEAWKLFKDRFWRVALLGVVTPIAGLITATVSAASISAFGSAGLVITALLMVATLYLGLAVGYAMVRVVIKSGAVKESISIGFKKAWSYFWIGLLLSAVILGGFVMGIVPGFIFSVWFMFAYFVLVDEDKKGMSALLRSREYIKGWSWAVFWNMILLLLVILGALIVASIPIGILSALSKSLGELINFTLQIVISIFSLAFTAAIYGHLVAARPELRSVPASEKRGFFIFSAILGAAAVVTVTIFLIVLNPSGLQAEIRDAQRISDVNTLRNAIAMYVVNSDGPVALSCFPGKEFSSESGSTNVDGTGWLPINLDDTVGGSPITSLPTDPVNKGESVYRVVCGTGDFVTVTASVESPKYKDRMASDGGSDDDLYEANVTFPFGR